MAPQPFTGSNNELASYSPCLLQILSDKHVLSSTDICGSRRGRSEDDEILVLPPLVLMDEKKEVAEGIVTLTSEGVLTHVSVKGVRRWSKKTDAVWSEFDERTGSIPLLFGLKGLICVATSSSVVMYSKEGRVMSRIPLTEALVYPMQESEDERNEEGELVLQTATSVVLYRASRMTCGRMGES